MFALAAAAAGAAHRAVNACTAPQLAAFSAAVLLRGGAAGKHFPMEAAGGIAPPKAASFSSSTPSAAAAAGGDDALAGSDRPGQAFLASLVDYEKLGVPKAAGIDSRSIQTGSSSSSSSSGSSSSPKFDLRVMRQLLTELGNPQQQLKVMHVAGTKGKGSVVVLLSAILRAAGLKVGTYTSPHLFDIRERVVVGGGAAADFAAAGDAAAVSEGEWEALAVQAQAAVQSMQQQQGAADDSSTTTSTSSSSSSSRPSHFEVVTAMALKHFAQQRVDIAVIETGLGGATDATNVFNPDQLQLAVLTAIGLDHVEALGGSLRSIAAAKAGIMKAGVPVVVGPQGLPGSNPSAAAAAAAAGTDAPASIQPEQQQQHSEAGGGSSSAAAEVWEVLRAAAGQADMQCPIVAAEQAVQVRRIKCHV
jgi:folylpolyglutamate synthase/dihydrofolate synthase